MLNTEVGKRCAACKNQRRKCGQDPQRYACVQRVFGASNAARMLQTLPIHERGKAADTMAAEAHRRVQDPVYGCAGIVGRLQGEIRAAQCELARTQAQIAVHAAAAGTQLNAPAPAPAAPPPQKQDQGDSQVMQDPFQGLDALLNVDYRVDVWSGW
ncbi:unnamed protein product [Urochloa humidicola]